MITIVETFAERVNNASFLAAIILLLLFYREYKKQLTNLKHEELLDNFLKD